MNNNNTKSKPQLFYEEVTEVCGSFIICSTVRPATEPEIKEARRLHSTGKCKHKIIQDEERWMYDFRSCAICGKGLGVI